MKKPIYLLFLIAKIQKLILGIDFSPALWYVRRFKKQKVDPFGNFDKFFGDIQPSSGGKSCPRCPSHCQEHPPRISLAHQHFLCNYHASALGALSHPDNGTTDSDIAKVIDHMEVWDHPVIVQHNVFGWNLQMIKFHMELGPAPGTENRWQSTALWGLSAPKRLHDKRLIPSVSHTQLHCQLSRVDHLQQTRFGDGLSPDPRAWERHSENSDGDTFRPVRVHQDAVLPKTVPQTFQGLMDAATHDLLGVFFYLDDVLVASRSVEDHIQHFRNLCKSLKRLSLVLNRGKCILGA